MKKANIEKAKQI